MQAGQWSLGFLGGMLRMLSGCGQIQAAVASILILLSPSLAVAKSDLMTDDKQCSAAQSAIACQEAIPACKRLLSESRLFSGDPRIDLLRGRVLSQNAWCEYQLGRYLQAESSYRSALALMRQLHGPEHTAVSASLNNLASVLSRQGKYESAEKLFRQSLEMRQRLLGIQHPDVATSLNNLADVLSAQGKTESAEKLFRQSLEMRQRLLGFHHPDTISSLSNLAYVFCQQGQYKRAEELYQQSLEMRQQLLGTQHLDIAISLNNLAYVLSGQGKYEAAATLFSESLKLKRTLLGTQHPDVAQSLNNLAALLALQGKYIQAEELHRESLAMKQRLLGAEHPDVAQSLHNISFVLTNQGRWAEALPLSAQAARIQEQQLRAVSSETRMRAALDDMRGEEDMVYGLLLEHAEDTGVRRLALTMALLRKGRAAEAGTLANRLLHQSSGNPQRKEQFERWQQVRQQREALLFGGAGKLTPSAYQESIKELSQQADDRESQLAAAMPQLRQLQPPKFDDILPAVAARLPKDGALIEVVLTARYPFQAKGAAPRWGTPHYVAMVLFSDQQIVAQDLGETIVIDSQVLSLLSALRNPGSDPTEAAQKLYRQTLAPLLSAGISHLYLSLDGSLSLVPFDALHDGTDYLLGRKIFHYLTSGRDLLRTKAAISRQLALVLADPDFGRADNAKKEEAAETFYQKLSALQRLTGAQREAQQIGRLLALSPIVGDAAKESVLRSAHAPWVLHIASHGLFLKSQEVARPAGRGLDAFGERKLVPLGESGPAPLRMTGDADSLSRSALVLAGAAQGAQAKDAAEDGLLTAEEARSLDLFGTQLVVLSACETGQGELSVGQGVYGLRRAFLVAGAETLVTSLWQVNDTATGKLMELYYQKLLKKRKGRLEGMQEAMKEMRAKYPHPYYWAPFLVIGSDGPLRPPTARAKGP